MIPRMEFSSRQGPRSRWIPLALPALLIACGTDGGKAPVAIRLVNLYKPGIVTGSPAQESPRPRTEWRFEGPAPVPPPERFAATRGFEAGIGVAGLRIREGRLVGRATTPTPILRVERTSGLQDADTLHAVEIRLRASAGANLSVAFHSEEKVDFADVISEMRDFPWDTRTPLVPGERARTYTLAPPRPQVSSGIRHLLVRPTDAAGANFEIEWVRLVFRKEYLASVPSGVSWQGLSGIYHETLVSRSPESLRIPMTLPERPWLDLTIGTVEEVPVAFEVTIAEPGARREGNPGPVALRRTLTRPYRWERAPIDLRSFAGRKIELVLSLTSEKPGALGFWGSPAIRNRDVAGPRHAAGGSSPSRGVILIWADTLRRDHLDAYGYARPTAPTLHRMAEEGVLFEDCVSQATWTKVSTPSLLTSLYPTSHGVHDFSQRLPASITTLAEVFHEAGYATLSLSSILFTGQFTNLHQGFDELHEDRSLPDPDSSKTAREYVDRVLPWLEAHRDVPFFVFLHISDPHDPYRPHPPYDTLWADASKFREHERQASDVRRFITDPLLKRFGMPAREELLRAGFDPEDYVGIERDWYDGSIRAMDVEIGRLIERLRELGIDRETLLVFTGDHGEEFFEHGRMFHGQSTYGELANVPLILWQPGTLPGGLRVRDTVETIDLMPTLLELTGLEGPAGMQGSSLVPFLGAKEGPPAARPAGALAGPPGEAGGRWARPAITEKAACTEPVGSPPPRDTESFAMLVGGWKLIHNTRRPPGVPEYELYDVTRDPLNQTDLAPAHPERIRDLAARLEEWRKKALSDREESGKNDTENLSPEELERLRSLGYIQ